MAIVSSGDIIRVVSKLSHPYYSQIQNVWHFYVGGTGTADDADFITAVESFFTAFFSDFDEYMSDATSVLEWVGDRIEFVVDHWETIEHIFDTVDAWTGVTFGSAAQPLPPATAALVRGRTDVSKHELRKYIAPFTEAGNDADGEIIPALSIALANAALALFDSYPIPSSSLEATPTVVDVNQNIHRFTDNYIVPAAWAYQRRRKRYVGI